VPLCPENGITFEDIGRIFGPPIFGGPVPAARRVMVWFLKRWNRVSDGLLDEADPNSDDLADGASTSASTSTGSSSSSPLPSMHVLLERADSFELLVPEEQEGELVDFRMSLADSADTDEYHGYHYPPLLQSQRRNLAAWARRKGNPVAHSPSHMHLPSLLPAI